MKAVNLKISRLVFRVANQCAGYAAHAAALLVAPLLVRGYARAYRRASVFARAREA